MLLAITFASIATIWVFLLVVVIVLVFRATKQKPIEETNLLDTPAQRDYNDMFIVPMGEVPQDYEPNITNTIPL